MIEDRSQPAPDAVTMSEIAELAGVSRSAASNWRRRHEDFPTPVETVPGGGDLFLLSEVEDWLTRHGRAFKRAGAVEAIWHAADVSRGSLPLERVIDVAAAALALRRLAADEPAVGLQALDGEPVPTAQSLAQVVKDARVARPETAEAFSTLEDADAATLQLVRTILTHTAPSEAGTVLDDLLRRRSRVHVYRRGEAETSETLRELVVRLADPQPADSVFDMAVGEGGFLLDAASAAGASVELVGQELNADSWRLATLRLLAHGLRADLRRENSLLADRFPDLRADLVLCDPPYGLRDWDAERVAGDSRWQFGLPRRQNADFAWIQHAIHHLKPDGRAYLLLPAGTLIRGGSEAHIRFELLKHGVVEAIVALPPGLAEATSIPLALWVLRGRGTANTAAEVLLIDASGAPLSRPRGKAKRLLDDKALKAIEDALKSWQAAPASFEPIPGFAANVPVLQLLNTEASLAPARWVHAASQVDPGRIKRSLDETVERLLASQQRLTQSPPLPPSLPVAVGDGAASYWRIRDLADQGHVTILRATRLTPDDYRAQGTPVLQQSDLRGHRPEAERKYVNTQELKTPPVLTEPGDVILATIGEKPYAVVDKEGGFVLGGSLQALRINCDWLDPVVVAALLSSSRTAQFSVGVAIRHVKLRDLEIPRLTPAETKRLRDLLERIDSTKTAATEAAASAAELESGLIEGVVAGVIRIADTPSAPPMTHPENS